jgi:hypothetical protein
MEHGNYYFVTFNSSFTMCIAQVYTLGHDEQLHFLLWVMMKKIIKKYSISCPAEIWGSLLASLATCLPSLTPIHAPSHVIQSSLSDSPYPPLACVLCLEVPPHICPNSLSLKMWAQFR